MSKILVVVVVGVWVRVGGFAVAFVWCRLAGVLEDQSQWRLQVRVSGAVDADFWREGGAG